MDEGSATWSLVYDAKRDTGKTAFTVQNTDTGEWKEKNILLKDFNLMNRGERNADLIIRTEGNEDAVFHMIEVNKI